MPIFFGGPRDGELVPPELDDGRGVIDIPVRQPIRLNFGDEPPIDDGFKIVRYRRHGVYVPGDNSGVVTRVDLWCPDNSYPGQYFHALKQHHDRIYLVQRLTAILGGATREGQEDLAMACIAYKDVVLDLRRRWQHVNTLCDELIEWWANGNHT